MNTIHKNKSLAQRRAFTLIEMIGVLAIIAILAAVIIPRVFRTISNSHANAVAMSVQSLRTAVTDYYAKNASFPSGTNTVDNQLIAAGLLEKPVTFPVGTSSAVEVVSPGGAVGGGANYDLTGQGASNTDGATLVRVVINGVDGTTAREINDRIDGAALGTATGADTKGRVVYAAPSGNTNTVYIYIAHH